MSRTEGAHAQSLQSADDLVVGNLANGVKYYVWNHPNPKGYCEFRLCVAVGSWLENDEESGLAHFVEHMAFKTTSHFTNQAGVIRFLEGKGAHYGHDLNASTGLFETTYKFQLPVQNGINDIDDGLLVLAEWAFGIRATTEDVETERPIIMEEWRTKRGAKERLKAKYWYDAISPRVAARFPIGDVEVIKSVTSSQVQAFYRRWYRPERMAVVIAGDFGTCAEADAISVIIRRLEARFITSDVLESPSQAPRQITHEVSEVASSAIEAQSSLQNRAELQDFKNSEHLSKSCIDEANESLAPPEPKAGAIALVLQDPEITECSASLELLHALPVSPDVDHLEREVTRRLLLTILDRRFASLTRGGKSNCPTSILDIAVASRPLLPRLLCTSVSATIATEDGVVRSNVSEVFVFLARELYSIAKVGVSRSEVAHAISAWTPAFSSNRAISSEELVNECTQHFRLNGDVPLTDPRIEMAACRSFLERSDDVFNAISKFAELICPISSDGAWRILVQGGPGPELDVGSIWKSAVSAAQADPVSPVQGVEESANDILASKEAALDKLLACSANHVAFDMKILPKIGATEFTLANGIVACCLRRDTPGHIALQAFVLGGSTELGEADECAMQILDDITLAGGLGPDLDGAALAELQSATQTRVNTQKHLYHRGLGGSTSSNRFGLLLKLTAARLRIAGERYDSEGVAMAVSRARARLMDDIRQREKGPHFELGQRARILSCGGVDIPVLRPVSAESVAELTADRFASLHARAFAANPAQLTFVLVGDLPPDPELGQLLSQHLCNLPRGVDRWLPPGESMPAALPSDFARGIVQERIRNRSAEKATVLIIFHAVLPKEDTGIMHLDAFLSIQAACRCAEDRLLARLRGEAGGVYSVSVSFGRTSLSPHGHISISFTCVPSSSEALALQVIDELRKLQIAGPSEVESLNAAKTLSETHARNLAGKSANSYWLFYILDAYKGERLRCAKLPALAAPVDTSNVDENVWACSHGRSERIASVVTPELLQKSFADYFNFGNYVHLVLEPEPDTKNTEQESDAGDKAPAKRQRAASQSSQS